MAKRDKNIAIRSNFCKLAMSSPKQAANELRTLATGLENCRNTSDVINALCQIFAVSERTVFNDLIK
jgi:hypothetical protein